MVQSTKPNLLCFVLEVPFHEFVIKVRVLSMPNNFIHRHTIKKILALLRLIHILPKNPLCLNFTYLYMFEKRLPMCNVNVLG